MSIEMRMLTRDPYERAAALFDTIQERKWILSKLKKTKTYEIFSRAAYISIANDKKKDILCCIKQLDRLVGYSGIIELYGFMSKTTIKPMNYLEIKDELRPYFTKARV